MWSAEHEWTFIMSNRGENSELPSTSCVIWDACSCGKGNTTGLFEYKYHTKNAVNRSSFQLHRLSFVLFWEDLLVVSCGVGSKSVCMLCVCVCGRVFAEWWIDRQVHVRENSVHVWCICTHHEWRVCVCVNERVSEWASCRCRVCLQITRMRAFLPMYMCTQMPYGSTLDKLVTNTAYARNYVMVIIKKRGLNNFPKSLVRTKSED